MPRDTALSTSNLTHRYGDLTVLADLSLDVAVGDLTAVVGPNGAGKSTLLRVAAGLETPAEGEVARPDPDRGHGVGYLPQAFTPRAEFTVAETVAYFEAAVEAGPDPERLLDRVGLAGVADRQVGALSGGMRRLLGLAVASVGDPALLVLDEPTSGLDPTMTRRVFEAGSALADDGRAVLVATHDLRAVERDADRVVLLDRGRVRVDGRDVERLAARYESTVEADSGTTVREGAR
ncbi:ABC transporter ATP-binding protein [Halorussus litoreus]|uniref:ABC transporter ATP-binding protein n=1 Tax=Halorussus litoreus TaxID=1710536 RepID=UPI000E234A2B|nr:ABC transporter ATP-binding protein [Halorussus litoreus]